jgi:hypothetical protein
MKAEFTAIVRKDGDWWVGWIEEIPGANAQERSKDELMISLRERSGVRSFLLPPLADQATDRLTTA